MTTNPSDVEVEKVLANGIQNRWYAICPSDFLKQTPISLRRLGHKIVLWRDADGTPYALEDHCPHRGAPLSAGIPLGNRLACGYHGVEVDCKGVVIAVPGSPGCKLEGSRPTLSFHVKEAHGALFLYNSYTNVDEPPPLVLPEELESDEYEKFLCYLEWGCDYRYVLDNVMDPMHGTFLHKQSHSMAAGARAAKFDLRDTEHGFSFEKSAQRDVNFDWTEFADTGIQWARLDIPYPKSGGPGGSFGIAAFATPIRENESAVFFWRNRKVSGWQRDAWRFLYRNRLEARHWNVVEQDRVILEVMEPDANKREHLYQHDVAVTRLRRTLRQQAIQQLTGQS